MNKIMNKWIVVTGGTKGIGRAIVDIFLIKGFNVITCSSKQTSVDALLQHYSATEFKNKLFAIALNLSNTNDCNKFVDFVKNTSSNQVDVLVNNVGVFIQGQISEEPSDTLEKLWAVNVNSAYQVSKGLIDIMKIKKSGHLFFMCSTASIMPYLNGGSYCITKYALLGMSKVLREEMKPYGVRVTSILPGATLTDSWAGVDLPKERFIEPKDVAQCILTAYELSNHTVIEELLVRPQLGDI
jgi:short-subunit dehydrogenase